MAAASARDVRVGREGIKTKDCSPTPCAAGRYSVASASEADRGCEREEREPSIDRFSLWFEKSAGNRQLSRRKWG